ncbi:MAG: radical SAM protein [Candidatus Jordarchaeaceae archaeon]
MFGGLRFRDMVPFYVSVWRCRGFVPPLEVSFKPTLRCNLRCVMCPQRAIPDGVKRASVRYELSTERYCAMIDELAGMGARRIHIVGGGEPLLRGDVMELMWRVKYCGLEGVLTTNGALLDEGKMRGLIDIGWDLVNFSVDAPHADVYEAIRGVPGTFDRVISNMRRLSQLRLELGRMKPVIQIGCVVMKSNYMLLEDMVELARKVGANAVNFNMCWSEDSSLLVGREDLPEFFSHLRAAFKKAVKYSVRVNAMEILLFWGRMDTDTICFRPWLSPDIWHNGDVTPCCFSREVMGNVRNRSFREVWDGEKFNNLRKSFLQGEFPDFCKNCNWSELLSYTVPLGRWLSAPKKLLKLKFNQRRPLRLEGVVEHPTLHY